MTSSSAGITDPVYRGQLQRTGVGPGGREPACGATPAPVVRAGAEACSDGVCEDVFAGGGEVLLPSNHPGGVAVAEEVTRSSVPFVEPEGVDAVQTVKAACELRDGRLHDHVVVRGHQAEGVDDPFETADGVREQLQERHPVLVVAIDRAAVDSTGCHVKDAVGKLAAKLSCHLPKLAWAACVFRKCGSFVTQTLRRTCPVPPT